MQSSTFYVGGFYLVEGTTDFPKHRPNVPSPLWTVSTCICDLYPDVWAFPWATVTPDTLGDRQQHLQLTDASFARVRAECDQALNNHLLGWPDVWLSLTEARTFYWRYLQHLDAIKLLTIALPTAHWEEAVHDLAPLDGYAGGGVYQLLKQRQTLPDGYVARGYDILGSEYGGSFHSFFCNGLEQAYRDVLHLPLNAYGLIDQHESAREATHYTNLETTGAEPVPWYPWLVVEYPLPAA
jgi:hypothetical protein